MQIVQIDDSQVDTKLDKQLRTLLSLCFSDEPLFKKQRFFKEPPKRRYLIKGGVNEVIAHVALHYKQVDVADQRVKIVGIAEVCVHPLHQGKGYVRELLTRVHTDCIEQQFDYSLLFGDSCIYGSSGYVSVENLLLLNEQKEWVLIPAMARGLCASWPTAPVKLIGATF